VLKNVADQLVEPLVDALGLDAFAEPSSRVKEELGNFRLPPQFAFVHLPEPTSVALG
jgi:hypothetical protein